MKIVIIGNSASGLSALESFRSKDTTSDVTMISREGFQPYSRVLLPYVLRQKLPYDVLAIRTEGYFKKHNVNCVTDTVTKVDTENKMVITDTNTYPYDKLLITSGSYAVMPPIPNIQNEGIYNLWTKNDIDNLIPLFDTKKKVVFIGSGFIALQGAWAACFRGLDVTVVELMDRILPMVLDEKGAKLLTEKIIEKGVKLLTSTNTKSITKLEDGSFQIDLADKPSLSADFIVVGAGVRANTEFLEGSGILVDRGIPVAPNMSTNVSDVYASGDVAAGPTIFGDKNMIHALWTTAIEMGAVAGLNMAGVETEYEGSLNMNVTQMYDVTVASMGKFNDSEVDDSYYFEEEAGFGFLKICYKDGLLIGACLVGTSDAVEIFSKLKPLIRKRKKIDCEPNMLMHYINIKTFEDWRKK